MADNGFPHGDTNGFRAMQKSIIKKMMRRVQVAKDQGRSLEEALDEAKKQAQIKGRPDLYNGNLDDLIRAFNNRRVPAEQTQAVI